MAEYFQYDRKTFEEEIQSIAVVLNQRVRDITDGLRRRKLLEERVYEMTTVNPKFRVLIYSSINIKTDTARENGGDAVRIVFWAKNDDGTPRFKNYKRHYRTQNMFKNLLATFEEINNTVANSQEITKWLWAGRRKGNNNNKNVGGA